MEKRYFICRGLTLTAIEISGSASVGRNDSLSGLARLVLEQMKESQTSFA